MHARHRSPVTANRSSPLGMGGVGTVSRVSPEGLMRGRGMINPEYRNYGRGGYGRGQAKQFSLPQPSPRGNDIFMEAGRLAAEYLVSKGMLPPNALSGKLQNGSLKSPVGDFQGFRPQEAHIMHVSMDGRTSALPRPGNAAGDVGHGRRRFPDEYNSMSSRSYMRGRRRNGSFKYNGSEFNRELGRSGSWNRARVSTDVDGQDGGFSRNRHEQQVANDSDKLLNNSIPRKINPEMGSAGDSLGAEEPAINREFGRSGSWNRASASPDADGQDDAFSRNRHEQQVANDSDKLLDNSIPRKINPEMGSAGDSLGAEEPAFNREFGRCGSWNRERATPDVDGQDDTFSGNAHEQQVAKDSDGLLHDSIPRKINPEIGSARDSQGDEEPALHQSKSGDDAGKNGSSISAATDLPSEGELEPNEKFDDTETLKIEADASNDNNDLERKASKEDIEVELCAEKHNQTGKSSNDLLSLSRFENVPKRTRSSLANRVLKVCHDAVNKDEDTCVEELPKEPEMHSKDNPVDVSPCVILSDHSHDAKSLGADNLKPLFLEEESCSAYANKQVNEISSSSFGGSMLMKEEEKIEGLPGFEMCSSINMERGEKRTLDDDNHMGGTKRPREVASSICALSDAFLYHSNSMEKGQNSQEPRTSHCEAEMFPNEQSLIDISVIPKGVVEPGSDFTVKQLFPGSLKTCDLNLMGASDVTESNNAGPVHIFPGITGSVKQEAPVDSGLTMGSNCNITNKYAKFGFDGRDIEVIDLDIDSEQEDKAFDDPERRSEVVFSESDGFSNNPHGANDIPDAQDGYGLMISELLGNDIPSCSSVPADMNSLHNDMGLHSGEGMLCDDDSIYMSLGEIPISFLRAWEQPTQEFGKPF